MVSGNYKLGYRKLNRNECTILHYKATLGQRQPGLTLIQKTMLIKVLAQDFDGLSILIFAFYSSSIVSRDHCSKHKDIPIIVFPNTKESSAVEISVFVESCKSS